ncbi:MAG: hypothetical protein PVG07_02610 [Acidobacteriota bacterium]
MQRRLIAIVFIAALAFACAAQASVLATPLHPAESVRAAGVAGYEVHQERGGVAIDLLDERGAPMGEVTVRFGEAGYRATLESPGRAAIAVDWNKAQGILEIKEPGTDRTGYSYFDFQAFEWTAEPAFEELVGDRKGDVDLLLGVVADYDETRRGSRGARPGNELTAKGGSCAPQDQLSNVLGTKGIGCSGYTCRGFGTGAARSLCCQNATNDANVCCWNAICIGCCSFLDCDAACGIGDYICFCGRTGTSCSET